MARFAGQLGCLLLLLLSFGCSGMFGPQGLPPDPLFANRKPIESKAKTGPPEAIAFSEPTPPINPYFVDHRSPSEPLLRTNGTNRDPAR